MTPPVAAVVLCAGKGTRMKSDAPKVLHPILGRPLAWYPITRAFEVGCQQVVAVVGHQADEVKAALTTSFTGQPFHFAHQAQQRGTGDAVAAARQSLTGFTGAVLILSGDVPLITGDTLQRLLAAYRAGPGPLAMLSFRLTEPAAYGRVLRDTSGRVVSIVEQKDATAQQRAVTEMNAGIYIADARFLWGALETLSPANAQGELYLTDIVAKAAAVGEVAVVEASPEETAGVNDRVELAERARALQQRINRRHMLAGVTFLDPSTAWVDEGVELGPDTVVGPNVALRDDCEVGAHVTIEQGCVLTRSVVGDGSHLKAYSVLEEARVGLNCHIGPFARLRPETVLDEGVHVGNFVETKKTRMKKGAKAGHLTYLGDATVGEKTNIGAGTITCNYDGVNKHQTVLGDGTTVTANVPAQALAMARTPQVVKEGWAERRKKVLAGLGKK
jgi:bifunctional UDP-N-acetylglucosamine pyrophosphorylase / glucosamine-1-phosphate N-acetyltransferase